MIGRLLNWWRGANEPIKQPTAALREKSGKPEPSDIVDLGNAPKSDPTYLFKKRRNKHTGEQFYQLQANSLEHMWNGQSHSSEMWKMFKDVREFSWAESRRDSDIERLIQEDQNSRDHDDRVGHVIIPAEEFEFHGDLSTVRYPPTPGEVKRLGDSFSLSRNGNTLQYQPITDEIRFRTPSSDPIPVTDFSTHTRIDRTYKFRIADGKIQLPVATSLEQAERMSLKRDTANYVQNMLKVAKARRGASRRLNQGPYDRSDRHSTVIADEVNEAFYIEDAYLGTYSRDTYAVQHDSMGFRIFNETEHGHNLDQPSLLSEAKFGPNLVLVSRRRNSHSSHQIVWDKRVGTVEYTLKSDPTSPPLPPPETSKPENKKREPEGIPKISSRPEIPARAPNRDLPPEFSSSGPIRSHGGGRHTFVSKDGYGKFPQEYTDPKNGKTYRKTSYRVLNGDTLYVERE